MRKMLMVGTIAAMLAAGAALAATLNISWQNATQNTDGSAIPASGAGSLVSTTVEYGPCNAAKDALASITGTITTPYPGTAPATKPDVPPGTWCGRAWHTNTYGVTSDPTAVASAVKDPPKPNKPANFSFGL
jgi:hypothetical protein